MIDKNTAKLTTFSQSDLKISRIASLLSISERKVTLFLLRPSKTTIEAVFRSSEKIIRNFVIDKKQNFRLPMPPIEETSTELQERLQKLQDQLTAIPEREEGIHDSLKASVLLDLGKAQIEAGNFDTALAHLQDSVDLTEENSLERAAANVEISVVHSELSQLEEAENAIHAAIQTYLLQEEKKRTT